MQFRKTPRKLFRLFLQGVLILAPISITIWVLYALFAWIDGILPNLVYNLIKLVGKEPSGYPLKIPGLGFIVFIAIALFVGYISPSFIVSRLVDFADHLLERTPGIKLIYSTIKDFFEAFAGNKRKFTKSVLVSIGEADVWQIGFITQEELHEFELKDYVAVYVPQSYAFAGHLYFVKRDRVRILTDISSTDAMKFAISGGVAAIEEPTPDMASAESGASSRAGNPPASAPAPGPAPASGSVPASAPASVPASAPPSSPAPASTAPGR